MNIEKELKKVDYSFTKKQIKEKLDNLIPNNDYTFYEVRETKRTIIFSVTIHSVGKINNSVKKSRKITYPALDFIEYYFSKDEKLCGVLIHQCYCLSNKDTDLFGLYRYIGKKSSYVNKFIKDDLIFNEKNGFLLTNVSIEILSKLKNPRNNLDFEELKKYLSDYTGRIVHKKEIIIFKQNLNNKYNELLNTNRICDFKKGITFLNFITIDNSYTECKDDTGDFNNLKPGMVESSFFELSKNEIIKKEKLIFYAKLEKMKNVTCFRQYRNFGKIFPEKEFYFQNNKLKLLIDYSVVSNFANIKDEGQFFFSTKNSDYCRTGKDDCLVFFPNSVSKKYSSTLLTLYRNGGYLLEQKFFGKDYLFFYEIYKNEFAFKKNYF